MVHPSNILACWNLTKKGDPIQVSRTWKERLFSLPWKPWQNQKTVIPILPIEDILYWAQGIYLAHPDTIQKLKLKLKTDETNPNN